MKYINLNREPFFAFNIWSIESAKAIMDAAGKTGHAVILQTSMKAFSRLDREALRFFVTDYGEKKKVQAYLHLDHCRQIGPIQEAVACGWDSVMIDGSDRPLEENIRLTNEVCGMTKGKGILTEAEVGQIGGVEDGIEAAQAGVARLEDVLEFLRNTDVDMLAVAMGTAHGLYGRVPKLHFDLIERISPLTGMPLVVHGGTGLSDRTLQRLMVCGNIRKINISTDVKQAYRQGIETGIQNGYMEKSGFDPLRMTDMIHETIEDMAVHKLNLLEKV